MHEKYAGVGDSVLSYPHKKFLILLKTTLAALVLSAAAVQAQGFNIMSGRNHPELEWQVAETKHFRIMYPRHLEGIEAEAAPIAEASYDALARNLEVTFDRKIPIYLSDEDEIANGFAVPFGGGYTNIWVHVSDYSRLKTGREKWLRSVIAHELGHIFHYQKVFSKPRWISFLLGNPLPRFWTEGIAQYQTESWDAMRGDRWLRTAVLDDQLSYEDGRSIWNGRLLYAIGNSQLRYLAERYGDSTIVDILEHRKKALFGLARVHDFRTAFEAVMDQPYRSFYDEWRRHVNVYYNTMAGRLENVDSLGVDPLGLPGQYYFDVAYSPDTTYAAVLSLASLRRPVQRIYVGERSSQKTKIVAEGGILPHISWSPDGTRLAYARLHRGRHSSILRDLYVVNRDGSNRRRLTNSRRAASPSFAPDGRRIAFTASESGTDNIFVLDLESGADSALTHFAGDVQISSIRWHPTDEELVFDRFTDDGRRDVALLNLADGSIQSLTHGGHDDRDPVWSPDGNRIAFTSLRDHVPNVFIYDRVKARSERVTSLATGAEVRDWLPADSAFENGSLIITSQVTKNGDKAYRIDARRRAPEVVPEIPEAYAAWTIHEPPESIPAHIDPNPGLITARYEYRPLRNLIHVASLVLPYYRFGRDWGIGGFTTWTEPLARHLFFAAGGISLRDPLEESYALASYVNNTWWPTVAFSAYRIPGSARAYGDDLLVESFSGGDVSLLWPVDWSDTPYVSEHFEARLRLVDIEPLSPSEFDAGGGVAPPDAGQQADLRLGFTWRKQRPYWNNVIHPLDGIGVRLQLTGAGRVLGTDSEFIRGDLSAFGVLPSFGLHRILLYGRAQAQTGEAFAQDFVGLSKHDAVQIDLPVPLPVSLGDTERVRGYRTYALGNRLLFGTLEYRAPLLPNLQTRLLGVVSLGGIAGAVFADGGLVWTDADVGEAIRRLGVGVEIRNTLRILGLFGISHAIGFAQPARELGSREIYEVYYRIRTSVPF